MHVAFDRECLNMLQTQHFHRLTTFLCELRHTT